MPIPTGPEALQGLRALILEDNMIISLDAEQLLKDHGASDVHLAASVGEARKLLESHPLDFALLDVNLGSETSFPLVPDLNGRDIPFVFVTGYGERIELPESAAGVGAIKKPFDAQELVKAIAQALVRKRNG